ncbi:MAG: hypothetical protein MCS20_02235, partial [Candidatus Phytoplasma mali]|nr:hypothetical protein [Candidatus Phytoplasma australiense]MCG7202207.1 hypothetical protein [Candidatus Phytoplasma mali]
MIIYFIFGLYFEKSNETFYLMTSMYIIYIYIYIYICNLILFCCSFYPNLLREGKIICFY